MIVIATNDRWAAEQEARRHGLKPWMYRVAAEPHALFGYQRGQRALIFVSTRTGVQPMDPSVGDILARKFEMIHWADL